MYNFDFSFFFFFIFTFFIANLLLIMVALDHFIIVLVFLDILLLTSILLFIVYTLLTQNPIGYSYALIILGVAAADTAVGLGLFILFFKTTNNVSIKE